MKYSTYPLKDSNYLQVVENYYAMQSEWFSMTKEAQHLDLCACIEKRRKDLMFTGISACLARGLPWLDSLEMRPHCINEKRRKSNDIIRWHFGKRDIDATIKNNLLVASPFRMICDLAKCGTPESLLAVINQCLAEGIATKKELSTKVENQSVNMRGKNLLRRLLVFATPNCESPLETIALIEIYKAGFVVPQQQEEFYYQQRLIGRVDMCWKLRCGKTLILEMDGLSKYENKDVWIAEKKREDALRLLGHDVIRATWKDVKSGRFVRMLSEKNVPLRRYSGLKFPCRKK